MPGTNGIRIGRIALATIAGAELAELLDIDFDTAATIAERAVVANGVSINRDHEPWKQLLPKVCRYHLAVSA